MSEIFVNHSVVLSIASNYGLQSKDVDALADEMIREVVSLNSTWEGTAANSFIPSMVLYVSGLRSLSQSIDSMSCNLVKADAAMAGTDRALAEAY